MSFYFIFIFDRFSMDIDKLCISTIRCLTADMIHKAKSGHPGTPLGLAPTAHILFSRFINFDKSWLNRDRFILGPGHASSLLYSILHLYTGELKIDDLKQFRQLGSKCPGSPEKTITDEVEATTGALGLAIGYGAGMSCASLHLGARFNREKYPLFNHKVFAILSDGEMMEGPQAESASWAGHQRLDNLICIYDFNHMTINGKTDITFTEDVCKRYEAYGFKIIEVKNGDTDYKEIENAITEAVNTKGCPVLIKVNTTIGFGSADADTSKIHGTPYNDEQLRKLKENIGVDPDSEFVVPQAVYDYYRQIREKVAQKVSAWNEMFDNYKKEYPQQYNELQKIINPQYSIEDLKKVLPTEENPDEGLATRMSSGKMLNFIKDFLPGLIGGSADLTPSVCTALHEEKSFQPNCREGRMIEYGIREHSMQCIANGISYYGLKGLIPYTATFLVFYQFAFGAMRVAAMDRLRQIHVLTHDSIGLGQDGATHQNIENFAMLRSLPRLMLFRPADYLETSACYAVALTHQPCPMMFALSKQAAPPVKGASFDGALRGGYIVKDCESPKLIFVATGTEVLLALKTSELMDVPTRVVSIPCTQLFEEQDIEYRKSILPGNVPTISIEAGVTQGWERYSHFHFGVETFGTSAPCEKMYELFNLTPEKCCERAHKVLDYFKDRQVPDLSPRPKF